MHWITLSEFKKQPWKDTIYEIFSMEALLFHLALDKSDTLSSINYKIKWFYDQSFYWIY